MLRLAVALGLALACASCACAQQDTKIRVWLLPKSCTAFTVLLPEAGVRLQLVPSRPETSSSKDGVCQQLADANKAACAAATDGASAAGPLDGQLAVAQAGANAFVYVSNPHFYPILIDVLVVLEPSKGAAGGRYRRSLQGGSIASGSAKALGARRLLWGHHGNDDDDHGGFGGFFGGHGDGRGANCTNGTRNGTFVDDDSDDNSGRGAADSTGSTNSTEPATTDVLSPSTTGNTTTASTASNLIDQAANNYTGATRTWVKVAIIVAIVLVSLAILAALVCLVACLCRKPQRAAPAPAGKQFVEA